MKPEMQGPGAPVIEQRPSLSPPSTIRLGMPKKACNGWADVAPLVYLPLALSLVGGQSWREPGKDLRADRPGSSCSVYRD